MDAPLLDPLSLPAPNPAISMRRVLRIPGRIARMRALTHDTYEVVVASAAGSPPLHARAGQFATLTVMGMKQPRPYSFARDPRSETPGEHTFYLRLVPGGEMSMWLAACDRIGESVELTGPLGAFTLDDSRMPMLLLAGGSGMSAVKALAEEACRRQLQRDCLFLYGARTRADLYAEAEIADLIRRWSRGHRLRFVQVLSHEPRDSAWTGARGLVTDYLRTHFLGREDWTKGSFKAWLCGPPPMVDAGVAALRQHGLSASHIHLDVFADLRSPAPVIDDRQCALCDECLLVRPVADCIVEISATSGAQGHTRLAPLKTAGLYYNSLMIDESRCIRCYACLKACPHGAISV